MMISDLFLFFGLLSPFLVPLKLSYANVGLSVAVLLWLILHGKALPARIQLQRSLYKPIGFFLCILFFSSIFGLNPSHSFTEGLEFLYLIAVIPLFAFLRENGYGARIVIFILIGQSLTSLHTVLEGAFPDSIGEYSHGKVSEAGQLSLSFFLGLSALFIVQRIQDPDTAPSFIKTWIPMAAAILGLTVLGFSDYLQLSESTTIGLAAVAICFIFASIARAILLMRKGESLQAEHLFLTAIAIPLLTAALLINLKRGPWIGVSIASAVLFFRLAPRFLAIGVPLAVAAAFGIAPIRNRITSIVEHFFIHGGRSTLWELGGELLVRYPLGIGFENSDHLNKFSLSIPEYLNHFHSNFINIAVELGWLGLLVYLWWMTVFIYRGLTADISTRAGVLTFGAGCALLSWQIAGIGEYNFGDSEVFLLALITMGLVSARKVTQ